MTRQLKTLGPCLAGLLVLGALVVPGASAQQGVLTSDGPVTLTGEASQAIGAQTLIGTPTGGEGANALTAFGGSLECASATHAGHRYEETPHESVHSGEGTITITPSYGTCSGIGATATVSMNGCDYALQLEGTNGTDSYAAKTTIDCPAEAHVQIVLFADEAHFKGFCTLTITEKEAGYGGLTAKDMTTGTVGLTGTLEGITIHKQGEGILCAEEATTEEAELHIDLALKADVAIGLGHEGGSGAFEWEETTEMNRLTSFGASFQCPGSTYTGHRVNATPHEFLKSGEASITLTPHYNEASENCTAPGLGWTITTDMNGCDYVLNLGEVVEASTYEVTTDIVCPGENEITTTLWTGSQSHEEEPFCTIGLPSQTGLKGAHLTDAGNDQLDLEGRIEGITATKIPSSPAHSVLCASEAHTSTVKLDLDIAVEGHDELGDPAELSLSPPTQGNGVLTTGGEEVTLTAEETGAAGANRLNAFGMSFGCPGSTYTGHKINETPHQLIPDVSSEATLTPHYNQAGKNCTVPGLNWTATVDMNGCDFNATIGNTIAEHEYNVTFAVVCPGEEEIEMTLWTAGEPHTNAPFCAIDIGSQANLSGARAIDTNTTDGHIELVGRVAGITATKTALKPAHSFLCGQHETSANASFDLDVTVAAHDELGENVPIKLSD